MNNKSINNIIFIILSLLPIVESSSLLKSPEKKKMLISGYVREGTHLISKKSSWNLNFASSIITSYFGYCCRFGESFSCKIEEGRRKNDFDLSKKKDDFRVRKFLSGTIISYKQQTNHIKQWRVENQKMEMISQLELGINDKIQDICFANSNYLVISLTSNQVLFFKFPKHATKLDDKNARRSLHSIEVNNDSDDDDSDDDRDDDDSDYDRDDDDSDDDDTSDYENTIIVPWQNQVLIMKHKASKVMITPCDLLETDPVLSSVISLDGSRGNDYNIQKLTTMIFYKYHNKSSYPIMPFYSVKGKVVLHKYSTLIKEENNYKLFCHRRCIIPEDITKKCCSNVHRFSLICLDNFLFYKNEIGNSICAYDAYSDTTHHQLFSLPPGFSLEQAFSISNDTFLLITKYEETTNYSQGFNYENFYQLGKTYSKQVFIMSWSPKSNPKQRKLECLASTGVNMNYANVLLSSQGLLVGIDNFWETITFLPIF